MFYVFTGEDKAKKKHELETLIAKFPNREVFFINEFNFYLESFQGFLAGADIFSNSYIVVLDSVLDSDFSGIVLDKLESMQVSENIFVLLEGSPSKKINDILKEKAEIFKTFSVIKDKEFNIFAITDSFGSRNKKDTWVLMQKALMSEVGSEDILNVLIWQIKTLLLVKRSENINDTGLKPFVYNKSKGYSKNFDILELKDISRELTSMFHESHLGLELGPHLENFLLKTL
jgi:hypothetical protein